MYLATPNAIVSPETAPELIRIADRALRASGAKGRLPTPIEDLIRAANIVEDGDTEGVMKRFLSLLNEKGSLFFRSSMQKLRGIADLRERAVYVPSDTAPRERFAKGHELGHQLIPWHHIGADRVSSFFHDNEYTLSPFVQDLFDVEANFFSSEVIFQGKQFTQRARDYHPSFDAVFSLADQHGASRQATLRRYVEAQDEIIAGISYMPSRYHVIDGLAILRAPWFMASQRFVKKCGALQLPPEIRPDHPWAMARDSKEVCEGEIDLPCAAGSLRFQWEAWWNTYTLLILLRRRPSLGFVGKMLKV
jgi:Zn-dependent peptidase ImmA (M78 family)